MHVDKSRIDILRPLSVCGLLRRTRQNKENNRRPIDARDYPTKYIPILCQSNSDQKEKRENKTLRRFTPAKQ
jgi:hypothetical protein